MSLGNIDDAFPSPHVVSGQCPRPLVSITPRGWSGIQLQVYGGWEGELVTDNPFHTVSLQLSGTRNLLQRRNGRALQGTAHTGNIIVTPAGSPKEWRVAQSERCKVLVINLLPSLFAHSGELPSSAAVELVDNFGTRDVQMETVAKKLLAEAQAMDIAYGMYVDALTGELTVHLLRHYSTAERSTRRAHRKLSARQIQRVTDYVNDHLHEDLCVRDLAATVFMSPSHFAHVFKMTTKLAPHRFVIQRRIERAKVLLLDSQITVAEIAQRVGFSTHAHFSVVFHRMTWRTPMQFRHGG